jgi:hypothetical protein
MNLSGKCLSLLSLGLILFVSETVAQDTPTRTLSVNGRTADVGVVLVAGRSYVDIESLAQAIGGSVTLEPNRIALTIPGPSALPARQTDEGMSKEFQRIAVFSLAEMSGEAQLAL